MLWRCGARTGYPQVMSNRHLYWLVSTAALAAQLAILVRGRV